ncbi:MAG: TesB-like acyl-CoA thioesterase 5 [Nocardioides sp.]|nr:TesB-like acyl-CoA thioesterase 5 [Nocardioides sp.]
MGKSGLTEAFYEVSEQAVRTPDGTVETVLPRPSTAGPWSPDAQHGGPPAALLTRAVEALPDSAGRVVGRFTMELWGPVPLTALRVRASLVRPGRSVALAHASLEDVERGRTVATAAAWLFPGDGPPGPGEVGPAPAHSPTDGVRRERPPGWHPGYLDAVDWRWISGSVADPGPGTVWMRTPDVVDGEEPSPAQRVMACVDSASGASATLDVREWGFLNTELTVHLLRPAEGPWVCLDAETTLGPGSVAVASSDVLDQRGLVARSRQALLVAPR